MHDPEGMKHPYPITSNLHILSLSSFSEVSKYSFNVVPSTYCIVMVVASMSTR